MEEKKTKNVKEIKEVWLPVQVVLSDRNSAMVQYEKEGVPIRATVMRKNLEDNLVKETILNKAVKFGIDWSEIKFPTIDPLEINRQLRNYGIWTAQDARTKPSAVSQAIMMACAPLVSTILSFIKDK